MKTLEHLLFEMEMRRKALFGKQLEVMRQTFENLHEGVSINRIEFTEGGFINLGITVSGEQLLGQYYLNSEKPQWEIHGRGGWTTDENILNARLVWRKL